MNRTASYSASILFVLCGSLALAQMVVPPAAQPTTPPEFVLAPEPPPPGTVWTCLLYTSDAADE